MKTKRSDKIVRNWISVNQSVYVFTLKPPGQGNLGIETDFESSRCIFY